LIGVFFTSAASVCAAFGNIGGQEWNRTTDTRIFNPLLYRLSYLAKRGRNLTGLPPCRQGKAVLPRLSMPIHAGRTDGV
jgi:hypothetical protein